MTIKKRANCLIRQVETKSDKGITREINVLKVNSFFQVEFINENGEKIKYNHNKV